MGLTAAPTSHRPRSDGKFQPDPLQFLPVSLVLGVSGRPGFLAALDCPKPVSLCLTYGVYS